MRRLLAACGAAALSLAVFVPVARASGGPNPNDKLSWWTPVDQQGRSCTQSGSQPCTTAPDAASVNGTNQVVTAEVDFVDGVMNWKVTLQPESGGPASTCAESYAKTSQGYPTRIYISCPWDTTRVVARSLDNQPKSESGDTNPTRNWQLNDTAPAVNGKYSIQIQATSGGGCSLLGLGGCYDSTMLNLYEDPNTSRWREVYVTNGVSAPTGVSAGYDAGAGNVNVTWAPNPEPDVTYLVQEKAGGGNWAPIGTVPASATNYVRTVGQPGKYQYQVAAMRPAPTAGNASATETSNYVAASAVTVDAVSPPTTAAAGAGAPGAPAGPNGPDGTIDHSDDNGVVGSAGSTSTSAAGAHGPGSAKGTSTSAHAGSSSGGGAAGADSEAAGEGPDTGFASTLPYTQDGSADGLGSGDSESPESMTPLVNVPRPQDARALLIPLAGALAMFVLAAQGMYLLRRRVPATAGGAMMEDDFDDWMGF